MTRLLPMALVLTTAGVTPAVAQTPPAQPKSAQTKSAPAKSAPAKPVAPQTETLHDGEAGAIDDREILIGKRVGSRPGDGQIGSGYHLDVRRSGAQAVPESLRCGASEPVAQQQPGLD